jgi:hypothetical protein
MFEGVYGSASMTTSHLCIAGLFAYKSYCYVYTHRVVSRATNLILFKSAGGTWFTDAKQTWLIAFS